MKSSSNCAAGVMLAFLLMLLLPAGSMAQTTIDIQVSPNVLNLNNQGQVVTIHTDIAYSQVMASTVSLNGLEIDSWKADNQGNFVAKFLMSAVKNLPLNIGEYNTLTLEGTTAGGELFTGSSDILVVNNIPNGRR